MTTEDKAEVKAALKPDSAEQQPGESLAVITGDHGKTWKMIRGADGKFRKSANTQRVIEKSIKKHDRFLFGKAEGKTQDRLSELMEKLYTLSMNESNADNLNAIVKAVDLLLTRSSAGKVATKVEDNRTPVTMVIVPAPTLMHPEIMEERPRRPLEPCFAEQVAVEDRGQPLAGEYVKE